MRLVWRTALALAALVTALACTGDLADDGADDIAGHVWTLRALQRVDGTAVTLPEGNFTAQFQDGGRLSVRADCNTCTGGYQVDDRQMSLTALACTRAFCTRSAPVDTDYVVALQAARRYVVTGRVLTVSGERSLLVFER
jgi:heat shock protein HslJ